MWYVLSQLGQGTLAQMDIPATRIFLLMCLSSWHFPQILCGSLLMGSPYPRGVCSFVMVKLSAADRLTLLNAIAGREGTASQISKWYGISVPKLKEFVEANREDLERIREELEANEREEVQDNSDINVADLDKLWITQKPARIARIQNIADLLYEEAKRDPTDSTVLRELRSYMALVANELGQLLHRGAGESGTDAMNVDIQGVDLEKLR
jgi:hypothetical protein